MAVSPEGELLKLGFLALQSVTCLLSLSRKLESSGKETVNIGVGGIQQASGSLNLDPRMFKWLALYLPISCYSVL